MSNGSMGDRGPLARHLLDAIRLNRSRRAYYHRLGGTRALWLSRALVGAERSLLPTAAALDAWASRFRVPILSAELVDMAEAPSMDRPLPVLVRPEEDTAGEGSVADVRRCASRGDLPGAADALDAVVASIRQSASRLGRQQALSLHVAESARLMARRGAAYARQTDGATRGLSRALVLGHLGLLPVASRLDRLAAPLHARGVGIFVNDLPPIPDV
ncbi:MAG: hypothetical protein AAGK21_05535 [Bacteroidota bacterium]